MPPMVALVIGSLVLAAAFGRGLGVPPTRPPGVRGAILRWAHAAVWVTLAAMFAAMALGEVAASLVPLLGLAALAIYLVFLATLLSSRRSRRDLPGHDLVRPDRPVGQLVHR